MASVMSSPSVSPSQCLLKGCTCNVENVDWSETQAFARAARTDTAVPCALFQCALWQLCGCAVGLCICTQKVHLLEGTAVPSLNSSVHTQN